MLESATRVARPFAVVAAAFALLHASSALAAPSRAWVAWFGQDSDTCGSIVAPCRTMQRALSNVAAGGDVSMLTPIEGDAMTIFKAVNITNDGAGEAAISNFQTLAITAGAGDVVSLRGLVLDGTGFTGTGGIVIRSAAGVHIQNCVIRNFEGRIDADGIVLINSGNTQMFVSDTMVFNNGNLPDTAGIHISSFGGGSANVVLDRVHLENNVVALLIDGSINPGNGAHVVVRDSVVSGNASDGIRAFTVAGKAPAFIVVEHSSVVNNFGTGIKADGPHATILLNDNTITRNGAGIAAANGGQLISYGNNKNNNNIGPEGAPTGSYSQM